MTCTSITPPTITLSMFVSVPTGVDRIPCATNHDSHRAAPRGSLATTDTRACLTMAAAAGLEASPTKFMSPTRNGVPLPYPTGIAPLNLHSRDGGLVLALTAIYCHRCSNPKRLHTNTTTVSNGRVPNRCTISTFTSSDRNWRLSGGGRAQPLVNHPIHLS